MLRSEGILGETKDIGKRVELVPMDPHFHDITIALYQDSTDSGLAFRVHTYSTVPGVEDRVAFVAHAMAVLGGMEALDSDAALVRFACGNQHILAARRVFLEACKLPATATLEPKGLSIFDKKSAQDIKVSGSDSGVYDVFATGADASRATAIAGGLAKLAELSKSDTNATQVLFPCGQAHDALVGLLLGRALNVRAVIREEEMIASRGMLVAPSAQN
jgi:hypothetical protein